MLFCRTLHPLAVLLKTGVTILMIEAAQLGLLRFRDYGVRWFSQSLAGRPVEPKGFSAGSAKVGPAFRFKRRARVKKLLTTIAVMTALTSWSHAQSSVLRSLPAEIQSGIEETRSACKGSNDDIKVTSQAAKPTARTMMLNVRKLH
jgi:hypothetical protein